ncbi:MAG TPA: phenylalanine 4-monooxygenase [Streptosporangiaceae bacterium]|nr:phenylalanine 4-monooxygenase [Streptosporangiaceae bacterium]
MAVCFADGHPGGSDPDYVRRRETIAALALGHEPGKPIACVGYTDREHDMWQLITSRLSSLHREHACAEFLAGADALGLPDDHVPELEDVSRTLRKITEFSLRPTVGSVSFDDFYGALHHRVFRTTQYLRHHSSPHFSPEPDMVHEMIGHANVLANERIARIYQVIGDATVRLTDPDAMLVAANVFWFCLEYGVIKKGDRVQAIGAGLLSSYGQMSQLQEAETIPLDVREMATRWYDDSAYKPTLFCAESFSHLEDFLGTFFTEVSDDTARDFGLDLGRERW